MRARRALLAAVLCCPSLFLAAPAAAGTDSPWPQGGSLRANVRAVDREVRSLEAEVDLMDLSADRYDDWETCTSWVPVTEYGDPDSQFGFAYDDRNGTGVGPKSALAVDRKSRPGHEDYMFLDFSRKGGCQSAAPLAGGTADNAKVRARRRLRQGSPKPVATAAKRSLERTVGNLEKRVRRISRRSQRLETSSARFDEWESCVSWIPVTEYGDPDRKYGYLFGDTSGNAFGYRTAITIDRSEWDDPDYMFLGLVGGDRPGGKCQDEPGEAVDSPLPTKPMPKVHAARGVAKARSTGDRVHDLQQEVESLTEDVDDLKDPMAEFDLYDQCMYLIGTTEYGARDGSSGYFYGSGSKRRPALAFDMRGPGPARYQFMAFPGEEPPSIECNEDAGQALLRD